jgi:Protein of unknown function (DUF1588)/Protein of unknown function (DUF1592)/Protein of unknown function (DUF1595)/Protein of unknown function (DUF1587)/Protein of unknown function (DUF1585)
MRRTRMIWAAVALASSGCHGVFSTTGARARNAAAGQDEQSQALVCDTPTLGTTPLQRLTRAQYTHSLRDLLKVDPDVDGLIADDERNGPFHANIVAPISDLGAEGYATAAEQWVKAANLPALVPCDSDKEGAAACAQRFIDTFGMRAFRRPLTSEERATYLALYTSYGTSDGLRMVAQTMLQSPSFLYRIEDVTGASGIQTLDAFELASRLSFFIVGSTPDDTLLATASSGALLADDELARQATRLLADPRAASELTQFYIQWLELDGLDATTKDTALFPSFDGAALRRSFEAFVQQALSDENSSLASMLSQPFTLDGEVGARAGILMHPAFLAKHAHASQSGPVLRGKVILRNVLCQGLPDPPANVDTSISDTGGNTTARERLAVHEQNPACAACHVRIDGIGLAFETFDAVGAHRSSEGGKPIDSSGLIGGTEDVDGPVADAFELVSKLSSSEAVSACAATQWFRFALSRGETREDRCGLRAISEGVSP